MPGDAGNEWLRLTRLYEEKSEEELLDLAADFGNLTDQAQQVLRDEMRKRKLGTPEKAIEEAMTRRAEDEREQPAIFGRWNRAATEQGAIGANEEKNEEDPDEDRGEPVEFTWKTLLCECASQEEAWQIAEVLRRAGIESWIEGSQSSDSLDVRRPQVIVAADQLEEARAVLAKPIPQDVIDQSRVKVEDFVPPACPKCGAADPLLESVEPSNTWRCENCGARWSEPQPAALDAVAGTPEKPIP